MKQFLVMQLEEFVTIITKASHWFLSQPLQPG
jgi:hypothetical protein